jgi:hypothetical protein
MIDDFAAAYQDLRVTLNLTPLDDINATDHISVLDVRSTGHGEAATAGTIASPGDQGLQSDLMFEDSFTGALEHVATVTNRDDEEQNGPKPTRSKQQAETSTDVEAPKHKQKSAAMSEVLVRIGVSRDLFDWAATECQGVGKPRSIDIQVVPVLFNLGVNEMQTIANAAGTTNMQTEVNLRGAAALHSYFEATQISARLQGEDAAAVRMWLEKLDALVEEEAREKSKLVRIKQHSS